MSKAKKVASFLGKVTLYTVVTFGIGCLMGALGFDCDGYDEDYDLYD